MKQVKTVLTFVSGCAAAAGVGWLTSEVRAEVASDPAIHVCVAEDGVMRLAAISAVCPAGQKSLLLKKAEADAEAPEADKEGAKSPVANAGAIDKETLENFESRLQELENSAKSGSLTNRVVAPFEVVDRAGKRLFYVDRDETAGYAAVYDSLGKWAARLGATATGGYFAGRSADSARIAAIGVSGSTTGVTVQEGSPENPAERISLGRDPQAGTYRLKFFTKEGAVVAAIGQGKESGTGLVSVSDTKGNVRARMGLTGAAGAGSVDKGDVSVFAGNGNEIAGLAEGANGGGLLTIFSASGEAMVEAGVHEGGYGVVRAGPESFKPGYGLLGLPGSYISGKPN